MRDSRYAGQRFSPESQTDKSCEVAVVPDLAHGVPFECLGDLAFLDAASVVRDADHLLAAFPDLDRNGGSSGVYGVLHQFFHYIYGPLYHFSGSDPVYRLFTE